MKLGNASDILLSPFLSRYLNCTTNIILVRQLYKPFLHSLRMFYDVFSSGVEHYIRQLADLCLPHVVLHALDGEGSEALRHAVISLHGRLWQPADSSAVHLELWEHGTSLRALCQEEQPFPLAFIQGLSKNEQPKNLFTLHCGVFSITGPCNPISPIKTDLYIVFQVWIENTCDSIFLFCAANGIYFCTVEGSVVFWHVLELLKQPLSLT